MAKDVLGNDVEVGDFVQLNLDRPVVYGRITKISEGGLAMIGGTRNGRNDQAITAGSIDIAVDANAQFDPRDGRAPGLVKVQDPDKQISKRTGLLAELPQ